MKNYLIANWKENKSLSDIDLWFDSFSSKYKASDNLTVIICPSFPYLQEVSLKIKNFGLSNVFCGAQDVSEHLSGPHTGEVSPRQLKDFCNFCIVGHSETGESDALAFDKAVSALPHLAPILCLKDATGFEKKFDERILLVWEDPANISKEGIYKDTRTEDILKTGRNIRNIIGSARPLVYGGSTNPSNIKALKEADLFNGYLVGNASLDPNSFLSLALELL